MLIRRSWLFVALALVIGLTTVAAQQAPSSTAVPTADPLCLFPDQLRSIGLYDKALEYYERLASTPNATCAVTGYTSLVQTSTAEAKATENAQGSTPTPNPFGGAQSLYNAGYKAEAKKAAIEVIATEQPEKVPPDLDNKSSTFAIEDSISRVTDLYSSLSWLFWIVAAIVIAGGRKLFTKPTVDIAPFGTGMAESDIGVVIADLVQHEYQKVRTHDRQGNPKVVVDAAAATTPVDAIVQVLPNPGQIVTKIWTAIKGIGVTQYILSGTLLKHEHGGGWHCPYSPKVQEGAQERGNMVSPLLCRACGS